MCQGYLPPGSPWKVTVAISSHVFMKGMRILSENENKSLLTQLRGIRSGLLYSSCILLINLTTAFALIGL